MKDIGPNIRLIDYPLNLFGMKMGRNVTVFRLSSGKLVIHSTAPFSDTDVTALQSFGEPGWLLEATNFHDTFAHRGAAVFPDLPYFVPEGFSPSGRLSTLSLEEAPVEWEGELEVVKIEGMPKINEHVFFHPSSKTLVVADLIFNIPDSAGSFTLGFLGFISGIKEHPGNSRIFRMAIADRDAFVKSLQQILALDFEQIVVGHGDPINTNAKETLTRIFRELEFAV
ncbi:MAG: hypothetical protein AAF357_00935 [Verrucomicrobiota bacterium]